MKSFYKSFITSTQNKKDLQDDIIYNLHKIPKDDIDKTHYVAEKENSEHQCDLLFLPNDKGFKYLLVVTDIKTRKTDAQPLRSKTADAVLNAIKKIYNRNVLKQPIYRLIVDDGPEFKGVFENYFNEHNIMIKHLKPGQHLGIVDSKIKMIGSALLKRQNAQELITKKQNKEWVKYLKELIDLVNKYTDNHYVEEKEDPFPKASKPTKLLDVGTEVRTALFKPEDTQGKRLSGKFRSSDIRWDPKIKKITNIIIKPNAPLMYIVNNDVQTPYTNNKLQIISKKEKTPKLKDVKK
jgi:hypothetical protein